MEKPQHSKIMVVNSCAVTIRYCENKGMSRLSKTVHSKKGWSGWDWQIL